MFSAADQKPVALKKIEITSNIKGYVAATEITQYYLNTEKCNIETVYCFPVEDLAAVCSFEIWVNGRKFEGFPEEKEEAFNIYDQGLENGDGAFRLELEQRNILVFYAGNIVPEGEVKVRIRYINYLEIFDGVIRLHIPTALTPRYVPAHTDWAEANIQAPPFRGSVPYDFSVTVFIEKLQLRRLSSPSHSIIAERAGELFRVHLKNLVEAPEKDFILEMEPEEADFPMCVVSRHENGELAAMLKFIPELDFIPEPMQSRSDIVFVLDCSSSMTYSHMEPAREALELCLRSLSHGDYFNIVTFGSNYRIFSDEPVQYDQDNLEFALKYLESIEADMGGSELIDALQYVLECPVAANARREIVLITDGDIYNTEEILNYVRKHHEGARFYSFGIGREACQGLIRGLARITGGLWEIIDPNDNIQEKILRQFSRIIQPEVKNVCISTEDSVMEFHDTIPPIYEGNCFTMLGKVKTIGDKPKVIISGEIKDEKFIWECSVDNIGDDNSIPILWAADEMERLGRHNTEEALTAYFDLAKRFKLLGAGTSFISVEPKAEDEKAMYYPALRRIPIMLSTEYYGDFNEAIDIMPLIHETRTPYTTRGSQKRKRVPWYLQLLKTQNANGDFEGHHIIAERLSLDSGDFSKHLKMTADSFKSNKNSEDILKALITDLAVRILSQDAEAKALSSRAIMKADRYLNSFEEKHRLVLMKNKFLKNIEDLENNSM